MNGKEQRLILMTAPGAQRLLGIILFIICYSSPELLYSTREMIGMVFMDS